MCLSFVLLCLLLPSANLKCHYPLSPSHEKIYVWAEFSKKGEN